MRTIWIIDHYASEPQHGGIIRHYDFALELAKQGLQVVVISSSYSHFQRKYFYEDDCKIVNVKKNVHFIYLRTKPNYTENSPKRFLNMISYVMMVRKNKDEIARQLGSPDVVMGCSIHPLAWIAAKNIAKKFKADFYVEVRDFWPDFFIKAGIFPKWHPVVLFFGKLEKWAYKNSKKIITSLPFAHRYISKELGFPKEKIVWIGQPMDCDRFDKNSIDKEDLIPSEIKSFIDNSFVCTFAGYYKEYEGVLTMLEAAKILKEKGLPIKMLFVGSGSEKDKMISFVEKHNLSNVFVGSRIKKEAIPALLIKSPIKLGALSVENENTFDYGISKNKLNEYLYSGGCTIFGFSLSNSPVELSNGGFVIEPNDAELLAEKIIEVYKMSPKEFSVIDKNARDYIRECHSVDILGEKLKDTLLTEDNRNLTSVKI